MGKTVKLAGFYNTVIQAGLKTRLGWRPRTTRGCWTCGREVARCGFGSPNRRARSSGPPLRVKIDSPRGLAIMRRESGDWTRYRTLANLVEADFHR